ncbi:unnamed protein product [Ilex paraguariensis]|uniref:Uncharacterized protein n=1 Tax=Ilex paraguariensis TaxID=185542 RepID=A0ABC8RUY7_9AQUA
MQPNCHITITSEFYGNSIPKVSTGLYLRKKPKQFDLDHLRVCSVNGDNDDFEEVEEIWNFRNIVLWIAKYCILSYYISFGVTSTELATEANKPFALAQEVEAPGRMGYFAAVKRFLKVMAMVWAGSQVTKLLRAGGALALAPFVDKGLSWFTVKFKFESQGKAFMAVVGFCFGLALLLFFVVTLIWA